MTTKPTASYFSDGKIKKSQSHGAWANTYTVVSVSDKGEEALRSGEPIMLVPTKEMRVKKKPTENTSSGSPVRKTVS